MARPNNLHMLVQRRWHRKLAKYYTISHCNNQRWQFEFQNMTPIQKNTHFIVQSRHGKNNIGRNLWIILVLGPRQEHNTGAHEAAEIVDMAIDDTVISHDPSPEPDDLLQPQVLFQHLLHPFSAQVRVS